MCELYDDLETKTIKELAVEQKEILQKIAGRFNKMEIDGEEKPEEDSPLTVVKLGKCKGAHYYHKECLQRQYDSEAGDSLRCASC
jgi:hypothetical protein